MVVGAMMMMMMMDDKGMKKKERRERLQTCSGEERNQNGVSEGMCKLGQTLLRLLLLLPPSLLHRLLLFSSLPPVSLLSRRQK